MFLSCPVGDPIGDSSAAPRKPVINQHRQNEVDSEDEEGTSDAGHEENADDEEEVSEDEDTLVDAANLFHEVCEINA